MRSEKIENFGELCNGSTADSDSVCWGSNPYSPAKKSNSKELDFFICAARHNIICVAHATSCECQRNIIAALSGTNERCCTPCK